MLQPQVLNLSCKIDRFMRRFSWAGVCVCLLLLTAIPAYADEASELAASFMGAIKVVFDIIKGVGTPMAVVSVTAGAFQVMLGSEKEQSEGMNRIKWSIIAAAAIYLIPWAVQFGIGLVGSGGSWDPSNPASDISAYK